MLSEGNGEFFGGNVAAASAGSSAIQYCGALSAVSGALTGLPLKPASSQTKASSGPGQQKRDFGNLFLE